MATVILVQRGGQVVVVVTTQPIGGAMVEPIVTMGSMAMTMPPVEANALPLLSVVRTLGSSCITRPIPWPHNHEARRNRETRRGLNGITDVPDMVTGTACSMAALRHRA